MLFLEGGNEYAYALVDMAEAMSLHICEICGKLGKSNDGLGVEIVCTRCPECWPSLRSGSRP